MGARLRGPVIGSWLKSHTQSHTEGPWPSETYGHGALTGRANSGGKLDTLPAPGLSQCRWATGPPGQMRSKAAPLQQSSRAALGTRNDRMDRGAATMLTTPTKDAASIKAPAAAPGPRLRFAGHAWFRTTNDNDIAFRSQDPPYRSGGLVRLLTPPSSPPNHTRPSNDTRSHGRQARRAGQIGAP